MKNLNVKELNSQEVLDIYGGAPGPNTGFWYDAFYYVSYGIRKIGNAFKPSEESLAYSHQNGA